MVDYITVYSKKDIWVTFKDGTEIGRQIHEKYGLTCMEVTDEVFEGPPFPRLRRG